MNAMFQTGAVALAVLSGLAAAPHAVAHCDTLNGPVVQDARAALAAADVSPVLKWVKGADEPAVRSAFQETLAVRAQSKAAAGLADRYFFETLVRLHRAGEGEPYTGLKTAAVEPGIEAADAALAAGDVAHLRAELGQRMQAALTERFERVVAARKRADASVEAGRDYVAAYVSFLHFAEQLFATLDAAPAAHASPPH